MQNFDVKITYNVQNMVGLCHHGLACFRVASGGNSFLTWTVDAVMLNNHLNRADNGRSSSFVVWQGDKNSSP
jgi:hypothetical protein